MNESYRVMVIETVEDKTDSEGKTSLIVKGRSLEAILDDRVAADTISAVPQNHRWVLIGTATEIARKVFHDICIEGILSKDDKLPIIEGSLFPQSTVSEPTEILTIFAEPRSVYLGIKDLCELYNMGFRILRDLDTSNLYFDVYMGSDRTSRQSIHPAVIFSPDLENLKNTTEFKTIENYKNVAYVYGPTAAAMYIPVNVDIDISGFDRKVLYVRADDIDDPDPEISVPLLLLRGRGQLGNFQTFAGYDGELNRNIEYKYDIDYFLGDLVEMQSLDGSVSILQVTEQIFVSDAEGERTYPTLSLNQFIMQGTWLAWDYDEEWSDMTDEEWEDVP
jgi:hypothetical protein